MWINLVRLWWPKSHLPLIGFHLSHCASYIVAALSTLTIFDLLRTTTVMDREEDPFEGRGKLPLGTDGIFYPIPVLDSMLPAISSPSHDEEEIHQINGRYLWHIERLMSSQLQERLESVQWILKNFSDEFNSEEFELILLMQNDDNDTINSIESNKTPQMTTEESNKRSLEDTHKLHLQVSDL